MIVLRFLNTPSFL